MKLEKNKHDHNPTKILKVFTFGLFLLLPFWAILSTTAYTTLNPNANLSYYGENINETENHYNNTTLTPNVTYHFVNNDELTQNSSLQKINNINLLNAEFETTNTTTENVLNNKDSINAIWLYSNPNIQNSYSIAFVAPTTTYYVTINNFKNATFTINATQTLTNYQNTIYYETYTKESFLSDSFYYAVNQVEEQPLFNWTKETATYETFKTITAGFENTNNFIPVTLTYMFMVTCIYLIIDIVIECATWVTHIISGNKD